jgi:uncharacterized protein YecA (UPF0149 family)
MNHEPQTTQEPHVHGENCDHEHTHEVQVPYVRDNAKIGRNDPCSCNSGKKYKKCCGANV